MNTKIWRKVLGKYKIEVISNYDILKGIYPPILPIFKYINVYYQHNIYTPNINLTKFEPLKSSRSGDISLLISKYLRKL